MDKLINFYKFPFEELRQKLSMAQNGNPIMDRLKFHLNEVSRFIGFLSKLILNWNWIFCFIHWNSTYVVQRFLVVVVINKICSLLCGVFYMQQATADEVNGHYLDYCRCFNRITAIEIGKGTSSYINLEWNVPQSLQLVLDWKSYICWCNTTMVYKWQICWLNASVLQCLCIYKPN